MSESDPGSQIVVK